MTNVRSVRPEAAEGIVAADGGAVPLVAVGASAGGVEALIALVAGLPEDLHAALMVVIHLPSNGTTHLPEILGRSGRLPAHAATDGEPLLAGTITVAPPDHHLLVRGRRVELSRGPRENFHRPSIDILFRSAAVSGARGIVGVLCSGSRDDGVAGLLEMKAAGGTAICQDPADALFPALPQYAIEAMNVDYVLPAAAMGELIGRLVTERPARPPARADNLELERKLSTTEAAAAGEHPPGIPSVFGCPECGGVLWQVQDGNLTRFRCRTGHGYSAEALLDGHRAQVEEAFWTAIRALEESADLYGRLADRSLQHELTLSATDFANRARECRRRARALRVALADVVPQAAAEG